MKFLKDLFNRTPAPAKVDLTRRFDLIARVGQGSMSKVWRARDTMTGKVVALKILDIDKTLRLEQRFIGLNKPKEGTVAELLRHPHIVHTFEHGVSQKGEQFLVMEFVEGVGLGYLIDMQNETMRENRLKLIIQLGEAVEYFHKENWIHRDICPRNILVDRDNQIKLIDFGLVVPNTADFQKPGNRTGTPNYMAPELIKRQKTDQRIDVFSYSVTCYEMYTRRLPWDAAETLDAVMQHINRPPEDIRNLVEDIDEQVAETIMRGLSLHPKDRWSTISRMLVQFRKAHARLSGEDKSDPDLIEPVTTRTTKVKYWTEEEADDEEEPAEAELVEEESPSQAPKKSAKKTSPPRQVTPRKPKQKASKSSSKKQPSPADEVSDDEYEDADAYFEE